MTIFIKTVNDVEKRFGTSNYEIKRPLSISKNKKVTWLMKDKLGGKIVTTLVGLRPKTYYSNLIDDGCGEKKNK